MFQVSVYCLQTDDCVSHVSAVNLFDGCTSLHRTIEGGDNVQIVKALLEEDATCLNVQNDAGLSPLHLACTNGRKKTIEILLVGVGEEFLLLTVSQPVDWHLCSWYSSIRCIHDPLTAISVPFTSTLWHVTV